VYLKVILFSTNIEVIELLLSDRKRRKKKVAVGYSATNSHFDNNQPLLILITCRYL